MLLVQTRFISLILGLAKIASLDISEDLLDRVVEHRLLSIRGATRHGRHFLVLSAVVAAFESYLERGKLLLWFNLRFNGIMAAMQIDY